MMNKTNVISIATLLLAGATLAGVSNVHAADTDATANKLGETTTADFTVNPGYLTLDKAPSFHFGTIDVANLADSHLSDGAAADNTLKITDQRGVTDGTASTWKLTAALTQFKSGSNTADGTVTLVPDQISGTKVAAATLTSGETAGTAVWNNDDAGITNGSGVAVATFNAGAASLKLGSTANAATGISTGTYTADITWALTSPTITAG